MRENRAAELRDRNWPVLVGLLQTVIAALTLFYDWKSRAIVVLLIALVALSGYFLAKFGSALKVRRTWQGLVGVSLLCIASLVIALRLGLASDAPLADDLPPTQDITLKRADSGSNVWSQALTVRDGQTLEVRVSTQPQNTRSLVGYSVRAELPGDLVPVASTAKWVSEVASDTPVDLAALLNSGVPVPSSGGVLQLLVTVRSTECTKTQKIRAYVGHMDSGTEQVVYGELTVLPPVQCEIDSKGYWYPARELWDWERDKTGPTKTPVLNSYINTSNYGFEPAFLTLRRADDPSSVPYQDALYVGVGDQVVARLFIANDANEYVSPLLSATDVRVRVFIPIGTEQVLRVRGYVSSSNAVPPVIEDTADLLSDQPFTIRMVPGSVQVHDDAGTTWTLSDEISTDGVLVNGTGELLPGWNHELYVEVTLEIIAG